MKTSVEKQLSIFCNYEVLKRTGTSSNHKKIKIRNIKEWPIREILYIENSAFKKNSGYTLSINTKEIEYQW